jgi:polysaccharide biosynthesis protein PslJ
VTTTEPTTGSEPDLTESGSDGTRTQDGPPWMLRIFCLLLPALPAYLVLPGALKGNGSPARMMALMMFGLVLLGFMLLRRTAHARRVNPGTVILLLYFLLWLTAYGVGLLNNDDYVVASNRTRMLVGLIAHVGVGLYVLTRIQTARERDILLGYLAAGLGFACLTGFLQGVSSIDLRNLFPSGFVVNIETAVSVRMGLTRVLGMSQYPIEFSVLTAATVPLMIYFARNAAKRHFRILSTAACGIALLALPASVSRSGILALIAALLVYMFAFKARPVAIAVTVGALAIGGYSMLFPQVANALWDTITGSADDASIESRVLAYTRVGNVLHQHPLFGLGLGGSPPAVLGYTDDEWMQALAQGGFVGLTAMIVLFGGAVFGMAAALRRATSPRERDQAYMLGAMVAAILASSFTFDLFGFEQATVLTFLVFALLWSGFTVPVPDRHQVAKRTTGVS